MSVTFIALRERARRFLHREAVRFGVLCIHTLDQKAWRPCAILKSQVTGQNLTYEFYSPPRHHGVPGRVCRYCATSEALSPAMYYAAFGHDFNTRVRG